MSASGGASAGDNVTLRQLSQGERAPYSGTLIDEASLREIDIQMSHGEACEVRLKERPPCADSGPGLFGSLLYLFAGVAAGGLIVLAVGR